jgi:predicted nucleic acid-binding protein
VDWIARASDVIGLSVVTAAEVRDSVARANREGVTRKANLLSQWWDTAQYPCGSRILSFDPGTAHVAPMHGQSPSLRPHAWFADIATAATASGNDVTLLTRNVRHSQPFGIIVVNPFETVSVL